MKIQNTNINSVELWFILALHKMGTTIHSFKINKVNGCNSMTVKLNSLMLSSWEKQRLEARTMKKKLKMPIFCSIKKYQTYNINKIKCLILNRKSRQKNKTKG